MQSIFEERPSAPPVRDPRDEVDLLDLQEEQGGDEVDQQLPSQRPLRFATKVATAGGAFGASSFGAYSRDEVGTLEDQDNDSINLQLPSSVRARFATGLETAGDAFEACKTLFEEQLERAAAEKPLPNQPISGDSGARAAFLLLLADGQRRDLFLQIASRSISWPRLRPLVGAPPYNFLMPHDAIVLNASGFAHGRTNMTYEESNRVANLQQFGIGQLVDDHKRYYRIAPRKIRDDDPLPGSDYFSGIKNVILHVKIKRHSIRKKRQLLASGLKRQLLFPQVGENITLRESKALMTVRGVKQASLTSMRVKALQSRGGANTAAILVEL